MDVQRTDYVKAIALVGSEGATNELLLEGRKCCSFVCRFPIAWSNRIGLSAC